MASVEIEWWVTTTGTRHGRYGEVGDRSDDGGEAQSPAEELLGRYML